MHADLPQDALPGVAFAGDWHGNGRWAQHAIRRAASFGAHTILHAGDFANTFLPDFRIAVEAACARDSITLYAVRGNHDSTSFLRTLPRDDDGLSMVSEHVRMIPDGHTLHLAGLTLVGLGGAPSINRRQLTEGVDWWDDEQLPPRVLDALPEHSDIVLSHDAPSGVPLPTNPAFAAHYERLDPGILDICAEHRQRIGAAVDHLRPALLVHGHYHRRYSVRRALPSGGSTVVVGLDCDGDSFEDNVLPSVEVLASASTPSAL